MADNTTLNPGTGGDVCRTIDRTTAKTQVVALDFGGDLGPGNEQIVTQANPLPVIDASADNPDSPQACFLLGNPYGDFAGVAILDELINTASNLALNVNLTSGTTVNVGNPVTVVGGATPIPVSGVDPSLTPRRLLTDSAGRLQINNYTTNAAGLPTGLGTNSSWTGTAALAVQETSQNEGASLAELLSLMLTELRIANQLLAELPNKLVSGLTASQFVPVDDPNDYRNDPSFQFNNQRNILGN